MSSSSGPNALVAAWSVLRSMRVDRPDPQGDGTVDHLLLSDVLDRLRIDGVPGLVPMRDHIASYRRHLEGVDPDRLTRNEALTFWLNLYNAGALDLAARTFERGEATVLRIPGGFDRPWATIAGEELSLDEIEHGKVRRFGDPRIHAALVCGSASCPTLRYEPYAGDGLDDQLENQIESFLASGAALADEAASTLRLSRVFLWFGADFVRPHAMPTWIPATKRSVLRAIHGWLSPEVAAWVEETDPDVAYQPYDWSLACAVTPGSSRPAQPDDH